MKLLFLQIAVVWVLLASAAAFVDGETANQKPLTNDDVLAMVKAGLSDDTIAGAMDAQPCHFDVSPAALAKLKKQGMSAKLADAMVQHATASSSVADAAGSSASSAAELSPQALREEESRDPRLAQLKPEDTRFILDEGAHALDYCHASQILNSLFDCSCFSRRVVDARIRTNGQLTRHTGGVMKPEPLTNLVLNLDYKECAVPAKARKYGSDRAWEVLKMDTSLSKPQLDQICECTGDATSASFSRDPQSNLTLVNGLFNRALAKCREDATSGNTASRPSPSAGALSQAAPAQANSAPAQANSAPAAQIPAPTRHSGWMGSLSQARNRTTSALRQAVRIPAGTQAAQQPGASSPAQPAPQAVAASDNESQPPGSPAPAEPASPPQSSAPPSSAATGSGPQFFHVCRVGGDARTIRSSPAESRTVSDPLYVSDPYPVPMNVNINHADGAAFAHYLDSKYGTSFSSQTSHICGGNYRTLEAAQDGKQQAIARFRDAARLFPQAHPNSNIVETGWTWSGNK